jgi:hypothetical protein
MQTNNNTKGEMMKRLEVSEKLLNFYSRIPSAAEPYYSKEKRHQYEIDGNARRALAKINCLPFSAGYIDIVQALPVAWGKVPA